METQNVELVRSQSNWAKVLSYCAAIMALANPANSSAETLGGNVSPVLTRINPFLNQNGEAAVLVKNNNYSFFDLKNRSDLFDANDDTLSFRIVSVDSGTLKLNGAPVTPGVSMITAEDVVTWLPGGAGMSVRAFTLDAFDGNSYSAPAVPVSFDVTWHLLDPNLAPTIFAGEVLNSTKNMPLTISYRDVMNSTLASDADGDPISFLITGVTAGQLTKNGSPVVAGSITVGPHETLVWTPPANSLDTIVDAFSVKAWDLQDYSDNQVSVAIAVGGNHPPVLTGIDPFLRVNFEGVRLNETNRYSFNQLYRRADLVDIDDDVVSLRVVSVATGQLLINGAPAIAGVSMLAPGDALEWIPSAIGTKLTGFVLSAFDGKESSTNSVPVIFDVYNATPSFLRGSDITFLRGDERRCFSVIPNWAKNIQPYDSALSFVVSNDNPDLFISPPEITSDGTLLFAVDPEAYGVANASVKLQDDQGRQSATATFKITVQFVNQAPNVTTLPAITVDEDAGLVSVSNFITSVDAGSSWENWQTLSYSIASTNLGLYSTKPYVDATGTLYFKTATNAFGTDTLKLTVKDNGGVANGGVDKRVVQFVLNVLAVNDPPSIMNEIFTLVENNILQTNLTIIDRDDSPANAIISVVSFDQAFFASAQIIKTSGTNALRLNSLPGRYGNTAVMLSVSDGKDSVNFTIPVVITNINHPPHFSVNNSRIVGNYVAGKVIVPNAVTLIDKGGPNEANQIVTFQATASSPQLFKIKPAISLDGTLSYQLQDAVADGAETSVTITAKDNGKSNNVSDAQSVTIVAPSNPFPALKGTYNGLFFDENAVKTTSAGSYSATVTDKGAYSGKIMLEGSTHSFSGRFSTDENSKVTVNRAGKSPVNIELNISFDEITGAIIGTDWRAQLSADKSIYSLTSPTPRAGKYTLVMPRGEEGPAGHSFATVSITPDGKVVTIANLADGTTVSQSSTLSGREQWPLFSWLYKGNGCLISWATLTNSDNVSVAGEINWVKGASNNVPAFNSQSTLDGSTFAPATAGKRILNTTNLLVVVDTSDSGPLQIPAVLTTNNLLVVQGTTPAKLTLSAATGLISGTVRNVSTGTDVAVKAIVLQKQNKLGGYCTGPNTSGAVYNE